MVEPDKLQMTIWYGACALLAGYLRPQTHIQNVQSFLLLYGDNGYVNEPQYYAYTHIAAFVNKTGNKTVCHIQTLGNMSSLNTLNNI
jgi:hypothetical protein